MSMMLMFHVKHYEESDFLSYYGHDLGEITMSPWIARRLFDSRLRRRLMCTACD